MRGNIHLVYFKKMPLESPGSRTRPVLSCLTIVLVIVMLSLEVRSRPNPQIQLPFRLPSFLSPALSSQNSPIPNGLLPSQHAINSGLEYGRHHRRILLPHLYRVATDSNPHNGQQLPNSPNQRNSQNQQVQSTNQPFIIAMSHPIVPIHPLNVKDGQNIPQNGFPQQNFAQSASVNQPIRIPSKELSPHKQGLQEEVQLPRDYMKVQSSPILELHTKHVEHQPMQRPHFEQMKVPGVEYYQNPNHETPDVHLIEITKAKQLEEPKMNQFLQALFPKLDQTEASSADSRKVVQPNPPPRVQNFQLPKMDHMEQPPVPLHLSLQPKMKSLLPFENPSFSHTHPPQGQTQATQAANQIFHTVPLQTQSQLQTTQHLTFPQHQQNMVTQSIPYAPTHEHQHAVTHVTQGHPQETGAPLIFYSKTPIANPNSQILVTFNKPQPALLLTPPQNQPSEMSPQIVPMIPAPTTPMHLEIQTTMTPLPTSTSTMASTTSVTTMAVPTLPTNAESIANDQKTGPENSLEGNVETPGSIEDIKSFTDGSVVPSEQPNQDQSMASTLQIPLLKLTRKHFQLVSEKIGLKNLFAPKPEVNATDIPMSSTSEYSGLPNSADAIHGNMTSSNSSMIATASSVATGQNSTTNFSISTSESNPDNENSLNDTIVVLRTSLDTLPIGRRYGEANYEENILSARPPIPKEEDFEDYEEGNELEIMKVNTTTESPEILQNRKDSISKSVEPEVTTARIRVPIKLPKLAELIPPILNSEVIPNLNDFTTEEIPIIPSPTPSPSPTPDITVSGTPDPSDIIVFPDETNLVIPTSPQTQEVQPKITDRIPGVVVSSTERSARPSKFYRIPEALPETTTPEGGYVLEAQTTSSSAFPVLPNQVLAIETTTEGVPLEIPSKVTNLDVNLANYQEPYTPIPDASTTTAEILSSSISEVLMDAGIEIISDPETPNITSSAVPNTIPIVVDSESTSQTKSENETTPTEPPVMRGVEMIRDLINEFMAKEPETTTTLPVPTPSPEMTSETLSSTPSTLFPPGRGAEMIKNLISQLMSKSTTMELPEMTTTPEVDLTTSTTSTTTTTTSTTLGPGPGQELIRQMLEQMESRSTADGFLEANSSTAYPPAEITSSSTPSNFATVLGTQSVMINSALAESVMPSSSTTTSVPPVKQESDVGSGSSVSESGESRSTDLKSREDSLGMTSESMEAENQSQTSAEAEGGIEKISPDSPEVPPKNLTSVETASDEIEPEVLANNVTVPSEIIETRQKIENKMPELPQLPSSEDDVDPNLLDRLPMFSPMPSIVHNFSEEDSFEQLLGNPENETFSSDLKINETFSNVENVTNVPVITTTPIHDEIIELPIFPPLQGRKPSQPAKKRRRKTTTTTTTTTVKPIRRRVKPLPIKTNEYRDLRLMKIGDYLTTTSSTTTTTISTTPSTTTISTTPSTTTTSTEPISTSTSTTEPILVRDIESRIISGFETQKAVMNSTSTEPSAAIEPDDVKIPDTHFEDLEESKSEFMLPPFSPSRKQETVTTKKPEMPRQFNPLPSTKEYPEQTGSSIKNIQLKVEKSNEVIPSRGKFPLTESRSTDSDDYDDIPTVVSGSLETSQGQGRPPSSASTDYLLDYEENLSIEVPDLKKLKPKIETHKTPVVPALPSIADILDGYDDLPPIAGSYEPDDSSATKEVEGKESSSKDIGRPPPPGIPLESDYDSEMDFPPRPDPTSKVLSSTTTEMTTTSQPTTTTQTTTTPKTTTPSITSTTTTPRTTTPTTPKTTTTSTTESTTTTTTTMPLPEPTSPAQPLTTSALFFVTPFTETTLPEISTELPISTSTKRMTLGHIGKVLREMSIVRKTGPSYSSMTMEIVRPVMPTKEPPTPNNDEWLREVALKALDRGISFQKVFSINIGNILLRRTASPPGAAEESTLSTALMSITPAAEAAVAQEIANEISAAGIPRPTSSMSLSTPPSSPSTPPSLTMIGFEPVQDGMFGQGSDGFDGKISTQHPPVVAVPIPIAKMNDKFSDGPIRLTPDFPPPPVSIETVRQPFLSSPGRRLVNYGLPPQLEPLPEEDEYFDDSSETRLARNSARSIKLRKRILRLRDEYENRKSSFRDTMY